MKYMGSKSQLLKSELGHVLIREVSQAQRFIDLFAGSASVSHFVAERVPIPVVSVDVQSYARALSLAITARDRPADAEGLANDWLKRAKEAFEIDPRIPRASKASRRPSRTSVIEARRLCGLKSSHPGSVWSAYGGHYFSPLQALALDHLISTLPPAANDRWLAIGCVLRTASRCSASPGHTAQPFQPSETALPYIWNAWSRDVFVECENQLVDLASRHALVPGEALVRDGSQIAHTFSQTDLVFCDPPYSEVQYSRFYHVLEGIARGGWPAVGGAGRAPVGALRYASAFSLRSRSHEAFESLLSNLRRSGATVLVTFPKGSASNGISGDELLSMAHRFFSTEVTVLPHVHSTLGGVIQSRGARRSLDELLLVLRPK